MQYYEKSMSFIRLFNASVFTKKLLFHLFFKRKSVKMEYWQSGQQGKPLKKNKYQ